MTLFIKNNFPEAKRLVRSMAFPHVSVRVFSVWLSGRELDLHTHFCTQAVLLYVSHKLRKTAVCTYVSLSGEGKRGCTMRRVLTS